METKICSKCKKKKLISEFTTNKRTKDKLEHSCKSCFAYYRNKNKKQIKDYMKKWYIKNKNLLSEKRKTAKTKKQLIEINLNNSGKKTCNACKKIKSALEFYNKKRICKNCYALQRRAKRLTRTKEEIIKTNLYLKQYREKNKDKINIKRKKKWAQRTEEVRLLHSEKMKKIRQGKTPLQIEKERQSKIKYVKNNPEKVTKSKYDYIKRNPERNRFKDRKELFIEWSYNIKKRFNFICQCCRKKSQHLRSHHILPWADFPHLRYELNNGICLCYNCHKEFHSIYGKNNYANSLFNLYIKEKISWSKIYFLLFNIYFPTIIKRSSLQA